MYRNCLEYSCKCIIKVTHFISNTEYAIISLNNRYQFQGWPTTFTRFSVRTDVIQKIPFRNFFSTMLVKV